MKDVVWTLVRLTAYSLNSFVISCVPQDNSNICGRISIKFNRIVIRIILDLFGSTDLRFTLHATVAFPFLLRIPRGQRIKTWLTVGDDTDPGFRCYDSDDRVNGSCSVLVWVMLSTTESRSRQALGSRQHMTAVGLGHDGVCGWLHRLVIRDFCVYNS